MRMALLTVLHAAPADMAQAEQAVTAVRRALPRAMQPGSAVLLLCDLPDAPAQTMPQDALLLRRLQSGVMAIDRRRPGCAMLLVRRRVWDDAAVFGEGAAHAPARNRFAAAAWRSGRHGLRCGKRIPWHAAGPV